MFENHSIGGHRQAPGEPNHLAPTLPSITEAAAPPSGRFVCVGETMFPPRAPFFSVVHGSPVVGRPAGKAGLRPRQLMHGSAVTAQNAERSSSEGVALFLPRVGVVVVAVPLPEAGGVARAKLDRTEPLGALPEVLA